MLILSNTVVLLAFLLRKARSVLSNVIFIHFNFFRSHSETRLLLSTCADLYSSHAKLVREDLNELE